MAQKTSKKVNDVNNKIVEELLSKGDPSQLFGKDGLFNQLKKQTRRLKKPVTLMG